MRALTFKDNAVAACLLLVAGLSGCAFTWPENGRGGFAEHRFSQRGSLASDDNRLSHAPASRFASLFQSSARRKNRPEAKSLHVDDTTIFAYDERVAYLKARGAHRCAPGDLAKAEILLGRVKREWISDLYRDALINMERLDHRLTVIDNRIYDGKCQPLRIAKKPAGKQVDADEIEELSVLK